MRIKLHKTSDYTVIGNWILRDGLSLEAKGMMVTLLSLPDDWEYSMQGLSALTGSGLRTCKRVIKELEGKGYVERMILFPDETDTGRIQYLWNVYEKPKRKSPPKKVEPKDFPDDEAREKLWELAEDMTRSPQSQVGKR